LVKLKNAVLLTIIPICLILKAVTLSNGYNFDPWIYRFFPFELMFFLTGIISYRIYTYVNSANLHPYIIKSALPLLVLFIVLYIHLPNTHLKEVLYFITVFITVPLIYKSSKSNKFDRYIGEYSYTIYISHFFILDIVKSFAKMHLLPQSMVCEVGLFLCIVFSYLLIRFISNKIDAYRERRVVAKINFKEDKTYPLLFK
jgi:peptidoglycan/LPS O-acetylase OafA/YrhL